VDDDIQFQEFDEITRAMQKHPSAFTRALVFMQKIMKEALYPQDPKSVTARKDKLQSLATDEMMAVNATISHLQRKPDFVNDLRFMLNCLTKSTAENEETAKDPTCLLRTIAGTPLEPLVEQIFSRVYVAQIAPIDYGCRDQLTKTALARLNSIDPPHYIVSLMRFQAVLMNGRAVAKLHPVEDAQLFGACMSHAQKTKLMQALAKKGNQAIKAKFSKEGLKAARDGYKYSDWFYIRKLLLHGLSGYQTFYFGYSEAENNMSKVDAMLSQASESEHEQEFNIHALMPNSNDCITQVDSRPLREDHMDE